MEKMDSNLSQGMIHVFAKAGLEIRQFANPQLNLNSYDDTTHYRSSDSAFSCTDSSGVRTRASGASGEQGKRRGKESYDSSNFRGN
jgi:hypothetical protein